MDGVGVQPLLHHLTFSCALSALSAWRRALSCALHMPLVFLSLPELCFQFGTFTGSLPFDTFIIYTNGSLAQPL